MRMTNDRDQAVLRSAVSDAAANLLSFLPSLATGEVFAFGEGVALPTRLKLKTLPGHLLPQNEAAAPDQVSITILLLRFSNDGAARPQRPNRVWTMRDARCGQRRCPSGPLNRPWPRGVPTC
jgi:hypothetical protein